MSTLMIVDGDRGETRSEAIRRRLREELAGRKLSVSEIARRLGVTQQKLSRRMTGQTPLEVDEVDDICRVAGLSFEYVATGIRAVPTGPPPGAQVNSLLLPRLESNQQPFDQWSDHTQSAA